MDTSSYPLLAGFGLVTSTLGFLLGKIRLRLSSNHGEAGSTGAVTVALESRPQAASAFKVDPMFPLIRRVASIQNPPAMAAVFEVMNYVDGFDPSKIMIHIEDREIIHPDVVFVVEDGLLKRMEVESRCFHPYMLAGKVQIRIHYAGSLRFAEAVPLDPRQFQLISMPGSQSSADSKKGAASGHSAAH